MKWDKKKGLLVFVIIILLMPVVQHCIPFEDSGKLHGYFTNAPDVAFSWEKWFDGTYQSGKNDFCNDHVGFRQDMLRLNNQLDFSLFDICHAGGTVLGKDLYLYQTPYIDAYFGKDFCGYQLIHERSVKLKAIQDTLASLGKSLILVHAASKVTSYPEYLPENRIHDKKGTTNSELYRRIMDSLGVNQVDADSWFLSMKHTSREPLFSKQGIHWSVYGAMLMEDSLVKYMERMRHIQMPHLGWSEIEKTTAKMGDNDVALDLNLIFPEAKELMSYPTLRIDTTDTTKKKPSVIYLGDSFAFKVIGVGQIDKLNAECEYWGYFDEVHGIAPYKFTYIKDYDWKGALSKADCLVIMYTTFNFANLGNGFIEAAYDYYYPGKKVAGL